MNRRGFLGRTLRTLVAGAAAVVAAPAVLKAATAEAAAPVSHCEKANDVAISESWGLNERGEQSVAYEVADQTGPIYGVSFDPANHEHTIYGDAWSHTHGRGMAMQVTNHAHTMGGLV